MIGRLTTDLAAAEARAAELRRQLAVEKETCNTPRPGVRDLGCHDTFDPYKHSIT
jgi:hypothetical protein